MRRALADGQAESPGYGLFNVNKRIQLYYNQSRGIEIESQEGLGTTVSLRVPVIRGGEDKPC